MTAVDPYAIARRAGGRPRRELDVAPSRRSATASPRAPAANPASAGQTGSPPGSRPPAPASTTATSPSKARPATRCSTSSGRRCSSSPTWSPSSAASTTCCSRPARHEAYARAAGRHLQAPPATLPGGPDRDRHGSRALGLPRAAARAPGAGSSAASCASTAPPGRSPRRTGALPRGRRPSRPRRPPRTSSADGLHPSPLGHERAATGFARLLASTCRRAMTTDPLALDFDRLEVGARATHSRAHDHRGRPGLVLRPDRRLAPPARRRRVGRSEPVRRADRARDAGPLLRARAAADRPRARRRPARDPQRRLQAPGADRRPRSTPRPRCSRPRPLDDDHGLVELRARRPRRRGRWSRGRCSRRSGAGEPSPAPSPDASRAHDGADAELCAVSTAGAGAGLMLSEQATADHRRDHPHAASPSRSPARPSSPAPRCC